IFEGRIRELNYKTIRYPGHMEKFLEMYDMSEEARPATETRIIEELSGTDKDFVLVRVVAEGVKDGKKIRRTFETVDEFDNSTGLTAMMRTTAFPTTIIAGMMVDGQISERGVRTPDMCVPGDMLISEMEKRNIIFRETVEDLE
ncbi:MAG: saccharopine dehydrogenase, partial [Thermoplasmata archaeon]|nr:saccharopine dehydrogenase [Thermoplasmata archaeon]